MLRADMTLAHPVFGDTTIRDAQQADLAVVAGLLRREFRRYAEALGPELFDLYVESLIPTDDDLARTIVAEMYGTIVGTARLYAPGTATILTPADAAYVRAVAVRSDVAGIGIGRQLMAECARRARDADAAAVVLHSAPFMDKAVEMYTYLGYRRLPDWDFNPDEVVAITSPSDLRVHAYRLEL